MNPRWQYSRRWIHTDQLAVLAQLGEDGWELVAIDPEGFFWFKRRLPS